jgi:hypothetical protein
VVAAVSLSDIYDETIDDEQVARELKEAAIQISKNLGYHPNS